MAQLSSSAIYGDLRVTGKLQIGEQLTSMVSTGIAPFIVGSTTLVANLNANLLDGMYAASVNNISTVVARDALGNFSAGTITAALVGNASTATKLATPRTINGVNFDGSANITITANPNAHTHTKSHITDFPVNVTTTVDGFMSATDKVKLDGVSTGANKTLNSATNGNITIDGVQQVVYTHPSGDGNLHVPATSTTNNGKVLKAGSTAGSLSWGTLTPTDVGAVPTTDVVTTAAANKILKLDASGNLPTSITGNSATATVLATSRTIATSGDVTGTATSFNGSANITIPLTLASVGTAGTYTKVTTDAKGRVTSGTTLSASDIPTLTLSKISDSGTAASRNIGTVSGTIPVIGVDGKLDSSIMPSIAITDTFVVATELAMLSLTAQTGDVAVRTDAAKSYILKGTDPSTLSHWQELLSPTDAVTSVAGKTGTVILVPGDVGLGNVTNESKSTMFTSPTFTGTPVAPTAAVSTNTTQIATTAFVLNQKGTATPLMSGTGAVGTSLLYARQDHVHPSDTSKLNITGGTISGNLVVNGGYVRKTMNHLDNVSPQYWILCANTGNNDVNGYFTGHRTSGNYQSAKVEIIVTSSASAMISGFINTDQVMQNNEVYELVTLTYDFVSYVAIKYTGNTYPFTNAPVFTGTLATTRPLEMFLALPGTSVSDVTPFDNSKAKSTFGANTVQFKGTPTVNGVAVSLSNHNHDSVYLGISANAVSASKLATPRTISVSGDATGSGSFDGSANLNISVEVQDDSHDHVIANIDNLQSELDIRNIPYVVGTQSANTSAWTGISNIETLVDGTTIRYWLPRSSTSTSVTLDLTLKSGGTTGAIACYYGGTTRLTTHYGAGGIIILTYIENQSINGTNYTGWWAQSSYDSNTYDRTHWNSTITAGATIYDYKLLMQGPDGKFYPLTLQEGTGTTKTVSTQEFIINCPILYYSSTTNIAANATTTSVYSDMVMTLSYTGNQSSWTSQLPVYLKGYLNAQGNFMLDDSSYTSFITQTLPTSEDGFVYILLGYMSSTTSMRLVGSHPMYEYRNGKLRPYDGLKDEFNAKADTSSPIFTGTPTAPTAPANTDTTQLATTAFVLGQKGTATPIMNGTGSVGSSLLYARQDHVHPSDTNKLSLTGGTLTGNLTAPTFIGALTGNAATATKLATARTISLTGGVTGSGSFDGSGNLAITATVTNDSHTHNNYLPLTGGTLTGTISYSDVSRYWLSTASSWGIYWNTTDNTVEFHGAGTKRAHIDLDNGQGSFVDILASGNVGIGTVTPSEKLDVSGNIKASGSVKTTAGVEVDSKFTIVYNSTENSLDFNYIG